MHGLYLASTNEVFRTLHELPQSLIRIDGYPLVYLAWLHGLRYTKMEHRAAIHDWLPQYAQAASSQCCRFAHGYLVEPWLLLGLLAKSGRLFGRMQ